MVVVGGGCVCVGERPGGGEVERQMPVPFLSLQSLGSKRRNFSHVLSTV